MCVIAFYFSLSHPAWTQFIAVFQIGAVERALEVGCACELINLSVCESVRVYLCVCVLVCVCVNERENKSNRKEKRGSAANCLLFFMSA